MTRSLVLGGGGGKGAFQVGVLAEFADHGYSWDVLVGTSTGALQAAGYGRGGVALLEHVWFSIREEDVHHKTRTLAEIAWRVLRGQRSIYDHGPLFHTISKHIEGEPLHSDARPCLVGVVDLESGKFSLEPATPHTVWASCTIPVLWEPVVMPDGRHLIDGGARNVTPLGPALEYAADEILVILCAQMQHRPARIPRNFPDTALRALDIALDENAFQDVDRFLHVNELVIQARATGLVLRKRDGTPYRHVPITVIEPPDDLGDALDFSQTAIRRRYGLGREAASNWFATHTPAGAS